MRKIFSSLRQLDQRDCDLHYLDSMKPTLQFLHLNLLTHFHEMLIPSERVHRHDTKKISSGKLVSKRSKNMEH